MAKDADFDQKKYLLHFLQQDIVDVLEVNIGTNTIFIKFNSSVNSSYDQILKKIDDQVMLIHAIEELVLNGLIKQRCDISFIWCLVEKLKLPIVNGVPLKVKSFRKIVCQAGISENLIPAEKTLRNDAFKCSQSGVFHKIDNSSSRNDIHYKVLADEFNRIFTSRLVRE